MRGFFNFSLLFFFKSSSKIDIVLLKKKTINIHDTYVYVKKLTTIFRFTESL